MPMQYFSNKKKEWNSIFATFIFKLCKQLLRQTFFHLKYDFVEKSAIIRFHQVLISYIMGKQKESKTLKKNLYERKGSKTSPSCQ